MWKQTAWMVVFERIIVFASGYVRTKVVQALIDNSKIRIGYFVDAKKLIVRDKKKSKRAVINVCGIVLFKK